MKYALLVHQSQESFDHRDDKAVMAVASYGLQHPGSMNHTAQVAEDLRASVAGMLDGRITLADSRRRTKEKFDGPTRVTRRPGDPAVAWYTGSWPVTVADVLAAGADGYGERVERWARSVREALAAEMG
jgi:Family of unknown function (DUF5946)